MRLSLMLYLLLAIWLAAPAFGVVQDQSVSNQSILLQGTDLIRAPEISFIGPGSNWTYPYRYYPIYGRDERIAGLFQGSDRQAGLDVRLCLSDFNVSRFAGAEADDISKMSCSDLRLNDTGEGGFTLEGVQNGTYTLSAVDELNSTVLARVPIIVLPDSISVRSQDNVKAGDVLKVIVSLPLSKNLTRYYGAVMVSLDDYNVMKLDMAINDSPENSSSTMIAFANNSMEIKGLPSISIELVMKLLTLLPENSAAAIQPSTKNNAELDLLTDAGWTKGEYVLTCVAYSSRKGLLGLRQVPIEVT